MQPLLPARAAPAPGGVFGDTFTGTAGDPGITSRAATGPNGGWNWSFVAATFNVDGIEADWYVESAVNRSGPRRANSGTTSCVWYSPDLGSPDHYIEFTLNPLQAMSYAAVVVRVDPAAIDDGGMFCAYPSTGNTVQMRRVWVSGAGFSFLNLSKFLQNQSSPLTCRFEAQGGVFRLFKLGEGPPEDDDYVEYTYNSAPYLTGQHVGFLANSTLQDIVRPYDSIECGAL